MLWREMESWPTKKRGIGEKRLRTPALDFPVVFHLVACQVASFFCLAISCEVMFCFWFHASLHDAEEIVTTALVFNCSPWLVNFKSSIEVLILSISFFRKYRIIGMQYLLDAQFSVYHFAENTVFLACNICWMPKTVRVFLFDNLQQCFL